MDHQDSVNCSSALVPWMGNGSLLGGGVASDEGGDFGLGENLKPATTLAFLEGGKCLIEDTVNNVLDEFRHEHQALLEKNQKLQEEVERLKEAEGSTQRHRLRRLRLKVEKLTGENLELKRKLEEKEDMARSFQMERDGLKEIVNRFEQLPVGVHRMEVRSIEGEGEAAITLSLMVDEDETQLITGGGGGGAGGGDEDTQLIIEDPLGGSSSCLFTVGMGEEEDQGPPILARMDRMEEQVIDRHVHRKIKLRERPKSQPRLKKSSGAIGKVKRRSDRTRFELRPSPIRKKTIGGGASLHHHRPRSSTITTTTSTSSAPVLPPPRKTSKKSHESGSLLHRRIENHSEFDPKHRCLCGLSFPKWYHLKRHLSWFNEDYKFSCDHCEKRFFSPYHLHRHLKQAHKLAVELHPTFGCYQCGTIFTSNKMRLDHQKSGDCGPRSG